MEKSTVKIFNFPDINNFIFNQSYDQPDVYESEDLPEADQEVAYTGVSLYQKYNIYRHLFI